MLLTTLMVFAPGWRWMLRMTEGVALTQAARLAVFYTVDDLGHVGEHDGRAVAVRHDNVAVVAAEDSNWSLALMV